MAQQSEKLSPAEQAKLYEAGRRYKEELAEGARRREEEKRGGAPTPQRPVNTPKPDRGADYKKGGSVKSSASKRADGIAQRGKTKGRFV